MAAIKKSAWDQALEFLGNTSSNLATGVNNFFGGAQKQVAPVAQQFINNTKPFVENIGRQLYNAPIIQPPKPGVGFTKPLSLKLITPTVENLADFQRKLETGKHLPEVRPFGQNPGMLGALGNMTSNIPSYFVNSVLGQGYTVPVSDITRQIRDPLQYGITPQYKDMNSGFVKAGMQITGSVNPQSKQDYGIKTSPQEFIANIGQGVEPILNIWTGGAFWKVGAKGLARAGGGSLLKSAIRSGVNILPAGLSAMLAYELNINREEPNIQQQILKSVINTAIVAPIIFVGGAAFHGVMGGVAALFKKFGPETGNFAINKGAIINFLRNQVSEQEKVGLTKLNNNIDIQTGQGPMWNFLRKAFPEHFDTNGKPLPALADAIEALNRQSPDSLISAERRVQGETPETRGVPQVKPAFRKSPITPDDLSTLTQALRYIKKASAPEDFSNPLYKASENVLRNVGRKYIGDTATTGNLTQVMGAIEKQFGKTELPVVNPKTDLLAKANARQKANPVAEPALTDTQGKIIDELRESSNAPVTNEQLSAGRDFNMTKKEAQAALKSLLSDDELKFLTRGEGDIVTPEGEIVRGRYYKSMIEVVEQGGKVQDKTVYHEAFHAYVDKFVEKELYKAALKEIKRTSGLTNIIDIEESLAEGFAGFMAGRRTFTGRILAFFQELLSNFKQLLGKESSAKEKLYQTFRQGRKTGEGVPALGEQFRKAAQKEKPFVPSKDWQVIPEGTTVPIGGEFKIENGIQYGRWEKAPKVSGLKSLNIDEKSMQDTGATVVDNGNTRGAIEDRFVDENTVEKYFNGNNNILTISTIESKISNTGSATDMVKQIQNYAREQNRPIIITPDARPSRITESGTKTPMSQQQLKSWYQKLGFKKIISGEEKGAMYWNPESQPPLPAVRPAVKADPLMQEVKKYKSVEEFVKAQHETTYRGASKAEWEAVQQTGKFEKPSGTRLIDKRTGKEIRTAGDELTNTSPDKRVADLYRAGPYREGVVIEFKPEAKGKMKFSAKFDATDLKADEYLGKGLTLDDVARVTDKNGKVVYEATTGGKTKSQLTDIWNQSRVAQPAIPQPKPAVKAGVYDTGKPTQEQAIADFQKSWTERYGDRPATEKALTALAKENFTKHGKIPEGFTKEQMLEATKTKSIPATSGKRPGRPNVSTPEDFPKQKGELNVNKLDLNKEKKAALYKLVSNGGKTETLTHAEIKSTAEGMGIDTKKYSLKQQAEAIAKQLNTSRKIVELANNLDELKKTKAPEEAKRKVMSALLDKIALAESQSSFAGRSLNAKKIIANEFNSPMQRILLLLKNAGVDPRAGDNMTKLINTDFNNAEEVVKLWRELVPVTFGNWIDKVRYSSMLSGINTHMVNLSSNLEGTGFLTPIDLMLQGVLDSMHSKVTNTPRTRFAREGVIYFKEFWKQQWPAIKQTSTQVFSGAEHMIKGDTLTGQLSLENFDPRMLPLTVKGDKLHRFEQILDVPSKALLGEDVMALTPTIKAFEAALKYRQGRGINVASVEKEATQLAKRSIFRGDLYIKGEGALIEAIGAFGMLIKKATYDTVPSFVKWPVKIIVPFINIATNLAKLGVESNPVFGAINLIGREDKTSAISKMIMGGAATMLATSFALDGRIFGKYSTDKTKRDQQRDAGMLEWSVLIDTPSGKQWVQFNNLHPLIGFQFGVVAAVTQGLEENRLTEDSAMAIMSVLAKVLQFSNDRTYWANIADFIDGVTTGDVNAFARIPRNIAQQAIPFRGAMSWITRLVDTYERAPVKDSSFITKLGSNITGQIPGLSFSIPEKKTTYGEKIERPNRLLNLFSPLKISPFDEEQNELYLKMKERADINKLTSRLGVDNKKQLEGLDTRTPEGKMQAKSAQLNKEIFLGSLKLNKTGEIRISDGEAVEKYISPDKTDYSSYSPGVAEKMKRSHDFTYLRELRNTLNETGVSEDFMASEFERKGIAAEDLVYDDKTKLTGDLQIDQVKSEIAGLQGNNLLSKYMTMRVVSEGTGEMLLSDTIIRKLNKEGIINDSTAAWLKTIKWDSKLGKFTTIPGLGGKAKKVDLTFDKLAATKPTFSPIKLQGPPAISMGGLVTPRRAKITLPKVKSLNIQAPQGVKLSTRLRPMARTLSQLGQL